MGYDIVDGFHTGLLTPSVRTNYAKPYRSLVKSFDQKAIIERCKLRFRARGIFGSDWILSQGGRGSCNGYACSGSLARASYVTRNGKVLLSGEFVYAHINGGRDQGSGLANGMKLISEVGACPKDMVRHEAYLMRDIPKEAISAAAEFVAHECYSVDEEIELADGISKGFMGVVAVHASNSYSRLDQEGICGESNGMGNHAVSIDDCLWDGSKFVFDQPGSWDVTWGDNGRGRLTWARHFRKTVQYHQFFLIRGVTDRRNSVSVT